MKKNIFSRYTILIFVISVVIVTPFCISVSISNYKEKIELQKTQETVFKIESVRKNTFNVINTVSGEDEKSGVKYNDISVLSASLFNEGVYKYKAKILNDGIYLLSPILEKEDNYTILKVVEVANVNREIFYTFKDVENNTIISSINKDNIVNIEKIDNSGVEYIAKVDNVLKKVTIVSVKA